MVLFSLLQEKSEFTKWEYRVHAYLELLDLEDLISDLPRSIYEVAQAFENG
jgi:hypothetical protein